MSSRWHLTEPEPRRILLAALSVPSDGSPRVATLGGSPTRGLQTLIQQTSPDTVRIDSGWSLAIATAT
jgi:hypothetical protein